MNTSLTWCATGRLDSQSGRYTGRLSRVFPQESRVLLTTPPLRRNSRNYLDVRGEKKKKRRFRFTHGFHRKRRRIPGSQEARERRHRAHSRLRGHGEERVISTSSFSPSSHLRCLHEEGCEWWRTTPWEEYQNRGELRRLSHVMSYQVRSSYSVPESESAPPRSRSRPSLLLVLLPLFSSFFDMRAARDPAPFHHPPLVIPFVLPPIPPRVRRIRPLPSHTHPRLSIGISRYRYNHPWFSFTVYQCGNTASSRPLFLAIHMIASLGRASGLLYW